LIGRFGQDSCADGEPQEATISASAPKLRARRQRAAGPNLIMSLPAGRVGYGRSIARRLSDIRSKCLLGVPALATIVAGDRP
jgi:hypothetical protein